MLFSKFLVFLLVLLLIYSVRLGLYQIALLVIMALSVIAELFLSE